MFMKSLKKRIMNILINSLKQRLNAMTASRYNFADMKKILSILLTVPLSIAIYAGSVPAVQECMTDSGFELCIDGKIYSSSDPVWSFNGCSEKRLSNGALRTTYHFKGIKALKGLEVFWDRETFGEEEYVRERLRMRSANGRRFRLTNANGKNHLIFPRYSFPSTSSPSATEIRIGTYGKEVLEDFDAGATYDTRSSRNLASCHMFHPEYIVHKAGCEVKGPFLLIESDDIRILTSYEHASQDKVSKKMIDNNPSENTDAMQGVEGNLEKLTDDDLWFISTAMDYSGGNINIENRIRRGGYIDGEPIPSEGFYETVWSTLTILENDETYESAIHRYLLERITENTLSRKPDFYYNTWGMQRDMYPNMRESFTEERIMKEVEIAGKMGMDTFIMDDGWQQAFGNWTANRERLPNGLNPLIDKIKSCGMTPGIWLSLLGADPSTDVAKEHPEWIILDRDGVPVRAQWNLPAFDLVGGYYDVILESMKRLVDQGIRFFKWDAVNTMNSYQPGLGHGSEDTSRKERIDRYNYLLPFRVTSLMRELREYCPEVVVEIDLTEPERALIGLMPLQEGKFFWMNNGASNYGDYSTYRAKSMRNSINATHRILPGELLTYACYPFNRPPYFAQRYNVNTILQCGHGIWGDLSATSKAERKYIASQTTKAKKVLDHVAGQPLQVNGRIGSVPEVYIQSDYDDGWALMTAFSGGPVSHEQTISVDPSKVLGVLNHSYSLTEEGVRVGLEFPCADESREVFVLGNEGYDIRIVSSTGWLDDISLSENVLKIKAGSDTDVTIDIKGIIQTQTIASGKTASIPLKL